MSKFCDRSNCTVGIIGSGKLAKALSYYLMKRNVTVSGIFSRNRKTAKKIAVCQGMSVFNNIIDIVQASTVIALAVNDDSIRDVAGQISEVRLKNRLVIHFSGCLSGEVLEPAKKAGAMTAIVHPLMTVSPVRGCVDPLENAPIGLFCATKAWECTLKNWLSGNGHTVFPLPEGERPLYHSAAVLACAGIHQLFLASAKLLEAAGVCAEGLGKKLLGPMAQRSIDLALQQKKDKITGPWIRKDSKVVRLHLKALKKDNPGVFRLYRDLLALYKNDVLPEK